MRNQILFLLLMIFFSCSEVEDNQRYLIQAKFIDSSNQPISDVHTATIRGSNFFSPNVLLGNGISDAEGDLEFVSLVPTGTHLNMTINQQLSNFDIQRLNNYSTINLSINKDLLVTDKNINLGDFNLRNQLSFNFKLNKTSPEPAVLNWQLIYQSSSFCTFEVETIEDFNQSFECQNTETLNRVNDANNPNESLNLSVDEGTIITFIYSLNDQNNQVLEITPNNNEDEFEFNY